MKMTYLACATFFLSVINHHLEEWTRSWNTHKISSVNLNPMQLWFEGSLTQASQTNQTVNVLHNFHLFGIIVATIIIVVAVSS